MRLRDIVDFVLLSILWGASFLFMRIAVPEFGPVSLMLLRCGIGALTLLPILALSGTISDLRLTITRSGFVGVINSAIPFVLLAFSALSLTAGALSTLNATAPFWGAVVAYFWLRERLTGWQLVGMLVGISGVAALVNGSSLATVSDQKSLALAVFSALMATLSYGVAANFARKYLSNENALANATGSQIGAAVILLIPGVAMWPESNPGISAWLCILALGVFSTGIAYILYFRLIKNIGPSRAITVTFAIPVFSMFSGWLFLDETVDLTMILSAVVIILGCALTIQIIKPK